MDILQYISDIFSSKNLRKKILITLAFLALYRLLIFIPHPLIEAEFITQLLDGAWAAWGDGGLGYLAMMMWGSLTRVSIIAVWLMPFINASIIMQLLGSVIPKLEELKEQWEQGQQKIKQYTRWATFPLAFVQSIWIMFFIDSIFGWEALNLADPSVILLWAFVLAVGSILLVWIWELIEENGIANGISLIIFASIVAQMVPEFYAAIAGSSDLVSVIGFILVVMGVLVALSVFLVKTRKEIPVVYSRQWDVKETATLPIPLNPVGMIPIIFAIAFVSFPYLIAQVVNQSGMWSARLGNIASWIETNFNIYTETPSVIVIAVYFVLIVMFTFFYSLIMFNPEKMADNIQKRGGFIPGIRPWEETVKYINRVLMHLCLWGGMGLAFIGVYSYLINYLDFMQTWVRELGSVPVIISGAGVIIIVGVVQELVNKIDSELLMEKYDQI